MSANTAPISPIAPNPGFQSVAPILNGDVSYTAPAVSSSFFTAGINGARVNRVRVQPLGTNVATVLRIFLNNGGSFAIPTNNTLIAEITMPATTATQVAALGSQDVYVNTVLKGGYKLYYSLGTTVAAGFAVTALDGGDY